MTDYGYARTNRPDADVEPQHWALQQAGVAEEAIYTDLVASGQNRDGQTQLRALVELLGEGDTVIVDHLYRLGRSAHNVEALLVELKAREVMVEAIAHAEDDPVKTAICATGGCRTDIPCHWASSPSGKLEDAEQFQLDQRPQCAPERMIVDA